MAKVRPEFYVELKNRQYPTYPGVLIAAHEEGLLGIAVRVTQYPCEANGWSAVCAATVTMRGDGEREQTFEDVGDCSPKNASPQIALASIRMASTRAKGRALRDAIALGATLFEELPAWEDEKAADLRPTHPSVPVRHEVPAGQAMTAKPAEQKQPTRTADATAARSASGWEGDSHTCSAAGCGRAITSNNETMSLAKFKRPLCLDHIKEAEQARAAA